MQLLLLIHVVLFVAKIHFVIYHEIYVNLKNPLYLSIQVGVLERTPSLTELNEVVYGQVH